MGQLSGSLSGHYWTPQPFLAGQFRQGLRSHTGLHSEPWSLEIADPTLGSVRLSGRLFHPAQAERLLLVIHGLGGSSGSLYLRAAVLDAYAAGMACLCLDLRGADGRGEDFYHAGLSSDVHAALASPKFEHFRSLHVLGFSLGGHLALRCATEAHDPRLISVAAVCAPLDLGLSQQALDEPRRALYRRHVLQRLKTAYAEVARRRRVPTPLAEVLRVRCIAHWDELTVVPRFGFRNAGEYYRQASVGPRLHALDVPALLVQSEHDPMVPAASVRPSLTPAPALLDVRWCAPAGHVGFPAKLDLGQEAPLGLPGQVRSWLTSAQNTGTRPLRPAALVSIL